MKPETEEVKCCLCDNKNYKTLKEFDNGKLKLVKCKCGLIFFSPRYAEEYLRKLYVQDRHNQLKTNRNYIEEDKADYTKRLTIAEKYGKIESVLDIGCSTGNFLLCCRERGHKQIRGVDLNERTNEYCVKDLKLDVSREMPKQKYDLIHLSDVIEHLPDPDKLVGGIKKNLNDNGLLMITTPNINNPLNHILNVKPEEHLYYFTKNTIKKILEQKGFEILEIRSWSRYHSLKNVVNTSTASRIRGLIKVIIALRLDGPANQILIKNLYTDILAIARKN